MEMFMAIVLNKRQKSMLHQKALIGKKTDFCDGEYITSS